MVKSKLLLMVIHLSVILINSTSLSTTNLFSSHLILADNCYDSEGNYICEKISEAGSYNNSPGNDSGSGDSGAGDTNCSDEEGDFVCAQSMPDTASKTQIETSKPRILSHLNNYRLITKIGSVGTGHVLFNHPASIAADPNGQRFYVADSDNNRIEVIHSDGDYITEWGTTGDGNGQFNGPGSVSMDEDHKLVFVADIGNNRIEKFDIQGKYLGGWGALGTGEGQFDHPGDIALDPHNEILYVTDVYNNRIQTFYYDGTFINQWGSFGTGNGQFNRPAGITFNPKENLVYVSDTANNRIQVFDNDGNFVRRWGLAGVGNGQFARPDGIFFESIDNAIYVADRQNHRIQVFDNQGNFVTKWAATGGTAGKLIKPRDIVIDSSGLVYVVDKENSNVLVYGEGQPSPVATTDTFEGGKNIQNNNPGQPRPVTHLIILRGASVEGRPNFNPNVLTVLRGERIAITNKDTFPHTVTSGANPTEPNAGSSFDTSIMEAGKSADILTRDLPVGNYPYHCSIHPYMTGILRVE